jgi:hypothetical protein
MNAKGLKKGGSSRESWRGTSQLLIIMDKIFLLLADNGEFTW